MAKDFSKSEAELLDVADCIKVDSACNGELMNNGFASDKKSTMCTESNYSYAATQGTGTTSSCIVEIAQQSATGYVDMPSDGEQVSMPTVAQQFVPINVDTSQSLFKSYSSGVLTASCEPLGRCPVL